MVVENLNLFHFRDGLDHLEKISKNLHFHASHASIPVFKDRFAIQ